MNFILKVIYLFLYYIYEYSSNLLERKRKGFDDISMEDKIVENIILDTNAFTIISKKWKDPRKNAKINEYIVNGLLDGDKKFYITYLVLYEKIKGCSEIEANNIIDNMHYFELINNHLCNDAARVYQKYLRKEISYLEFYEHFEYKIFDCLINIITSFIIVYIAYKMEMISINHGKKIEELKTNFSRLISSDSLVVSKIKGNCAKLLFSDKKSTKIGFINLLKDSCELVGINYAFNNEEKHTINPQTIRIYVIQIYDLLKSLFDGFVKNLDILYTYLIERIINEDKYPEVNDFIDLYNICLIAENYKLITFENKWIEFMKIYSNDYPVLKDSYFLSRKLKN